MGRKVSIAIAGFIGCVLLPIIFLSSLMGAGASAACAPPNAGAGATGGADDPINLPALEIATKVYRAGLDTKHGEREILTAFTVVLVESGGGVTMANPGGGHADSVGAFQQRNFPPWTARNRMNVYEAATTFFEVLDQFDNGQSIGELAADVQRPLESLRYKYAEALPRARYFYERVLAREGAGGGGDLDVIVDGGLSGCGGPGVPLGSADVAGVVTLTSPRSYRTLPQSVMAPGRAAQQVDARIWANAVYLLDTYKLSVTAAREAGHASHGDGTSLDIVPRGSQALPNWRRTTEAAARAIGWRPGCGGSCSPPVIPAPGWVRWIGYNGVASHGDPSTCSGGCPAHLHISWLGAYGSAGALVPPAAWVKAFPMDEADDLESASTEKDTRKRKDPS